MIGIGLCHQITNRQRDGMLNINAVNLDGVDEYITFDTTGFTAMQSALSGSYSMSFWFYATSSPAGFAHLFSCFSTTTGRYFRVMQQNGTDTIYFDHYGGNTSSNNIRKYTNEAVTIGAWNNIVITYDSVAALSSRQLIYINGALATFNFADAGYSGTYNSAPGGILSIGATSQGAAPINIKVASLSIFNSILDSTAVTTIYNGGRYYLNTGNPNCVLSLDYSRSARWSGGNIVSTDLVAGSIATTNNVELIDGELT